MLKFKKNDKIIVISGKDKGKIGTITYIIKNKKMYKVIVNGINVIKKHVKGNPSKGIVGSIITKEAPISYSNIAHYNSKLKKACKICFLASEDGKKQRSFKLDGVLL